MTLFSGENLMSETDFPILNDSEEKKMSSEGIPEEVGVLPLKNTVLFPGVVIPITVGRDKSIQLVKEAYASKDKLIGVIAQRKVSIEDPTTEDIFSRGTIAKILKRFKMPDGSITIVIQGRSRFEVQEFTKTDPYFKASVLKLPDEYPTSRESGAIMMSLKQEADRIIELSPHIPSEAKIALQNISSLSFLIHFIASNLTLEVVDKQEILEMDSLLEKGQHVLQMMGKELAILELSEEIQSKVKTDLDAQQREYFLRQQIKAIQDELGDEGGETDIEGLRSRGDKKKWPETVKEVFDKEVSKLARLNPHMPDYAVVVNYVEWLLDLPWQNYTDDKFKFKEVRKILDEDHYGLEKVKERILEYLAVLKLKADKKAPILCFHGPPGVGKTSLGKSIARAMKREFIRISLGGVRDEAEIRGHRRTYIGAMPGRIIQGLKKAKTGNPVFMLDEIDKVGNDHRGDPSSALLEVLDPEQNNSFADHYLEVEYDLSSVMFIATANTLGSIHPALLDRMEIIEINGYSLEEKLEIAKRYLIPRLQREHGIKKSQLSISEPALKGIIENYTRESGVRKLSQKISNVNRVAAKEIVLNDKKRVSLTGKNIEEFLGIAPFETELYKKSNAPGVAIGLAWTPVGGDILFIETSITRGTGKFRVTGQLGDVMKESASLAFTYIRSMATQLGLHHEVFNHWDVHLHFPAGSIPKDGPSAGVTIMSAIASIFTQRLVKAGMAMTGEITLRGKVLPVGGIKEKVLAARRAGIKTILLPAENKKDVLEIKSQYIKDIRFHYMETMKDVLDIALEKRAVRDPITLLPKDIVQKELPKGGKTIPYQA